MAGREKRYPLSSWRGPERRYDLVAEGSIAVVFVAVLCVVLAILFGSPDGGLTHPGGPKSAAGEAFSAKYWDAADPSDLAETAVGELAATTTTAQYGPPFNHTGGSSQSVLGVTPAAIAARIFGLTLPINTAKQFVLAPVSQLMGPLRPSVAAAVAQYEAAGGDLTPGASADEVASARQQTWLTNFSNALSRPSAKVTSTAISVPAGNYGPVPVIIAAELQIAHNGGLDGYFESSPQQLNTNTTDATMFFSDGTLWSSIASAQGVAGDQWGVMNEIWNFPGQVWLWLYAGMYQVPWLDPSNNHNLDLDVGVLMVLLGFLLPMFAPWIPLVNRIPNWIPFYKVIYRRYYARMAPKAAAAADPPPPSGAD